MDWSEGSYERFAGELEPAAAQAVSALAPARGSRILDLACGTGNAALELARLGAEVTGADPAARLLDIARERLAREGHDAEWVEASAEGLPFVDDEFDGLVSVFGVVFSERPREAAAEMRRVNRPGGIITITAWLPRGGIAEAVKLLRERSAGPDPPPQPPGEAVDWTSPGDLRDLFGDEIDVTEHELVFRADTPEAWVAEQRTYHPAWLAMRQQIAEPEFGDLETEVVETLRRHDTGSDGFEVRSPYVLARAAV